MNSRQRLMTVLHGGKADRIPWNIYAWLLPQTDSARALLPKGLGLMDTRRIFRENVAEINVAIDRSLRDGVPFIHTRIQTPMGTITQDALIEPGYGSLWIKKFFISSPEDYAPAEFYFRNMRCEPDFEPWRQADTKLGSDGIVVGEIIPVPFMTLVVNWLGIEGMVEGVYKQTERFEALLDAVEKVYDRQIQLAAESPAEVIWFGDNVTASIVSPRLFERYIAPTYSRVLPTLSAAGKFPIAHYDGSNRPLLRNLARTTLPVIEAFTPPPGGDVEVSTAKEAWPGKVVWINFPGTLFLDPPETIYAYTMQLLADAAPGGRIVMGCTEDFPLEHFDKTFYAIGRALADYEGRGWES
jgi:hypothetical protein